MKRAAQSFALSLFVMFTAAYSCGQNGPTQPSVTISYTQSTTPGITANCLYRSTTSTPVLPGTCSSNAATTLTDSTPTAGTTYNYWVTAQVGATESAYAGPVSVPVPSNPNAPTNPGVKQVTKNDMPGDAPSDIVAKVTWTKRP
jgi:hypothetical protein